jgi:carboxypeptidase Q
MKHMLCAIGVFWLAGAMSLARQGIDPSILAKIRAEGMERSQVGPVFEHLTIDIGPRLTASPAHKRAAEWMRQRLASYGLADPHLEAFTFGRGWALEKLTVEMIEPRYLPLIGYADAWSPPTAGELVATPILAPVKTPEDVAAIKDRLKGAIFMPQDILVDFVRKDRPNPTDPAYQANAAAYATSAGQRPPTSGAETPQQRARRLTQALHDAGVSVVLKPSVGEHGTVFVTGRDNGAAAYPAVTMSAEHYNMIARMLQHNLPVKLRVDVRTRYVDADAGNAYNVIAELPGTDARLKEEVVMIGAHLDSWHTGVGATDNADGVATVTEAMRILKTIGARPRRTIRVALWAGEEQGLLGSKAWAAAHLAGDANRGAREKFDVYFNIDNGTGPIYGFYLQGQKAIEPLFDAWLEPLKALGARKNTIEPIGSTDHLSFIDVGVPGFNPIQDYVNYDIRTHHTNMDTIERLQEKDIRQAAIAMAWFAYQAAMADQPIPRPRS